MLHGVYCNAGLAANRHAVYEKDTNRAVLLVPFTVAGYVKPHAYTGQSGTWTLRCNDVFFNAEVGFASPQLAVENGECAYLITTVDTKPAAGPLAHFEVGGGHMQRRGGGISA